MRDEQTTDQTLKIELLSQWKLEAEFRNSRIPHFSCRTSVSVFIIWCDNDLARPSPPLLLSHFCYHTSTIGTLWEGSQRAGFCQSAKREGRRRESTIDRSKVEK